MPLAPAIAAALTTAGAHRWTLFLAGEDVTKLPGTLGFGVSPESIEVVEAGPGRVSSMTFLVDDPQKQINVAELAEVLFVDTAAAAADGREFFGYVAEATKRSAFGGQGRVWSVRALGAEVWLDWLRWYDPLGLTLSITLGGATAPADIIRTYFAPLSGHPLRTIIQSGAGNGTLAAPISGTLDNGATGAAVMTPGSFTAGQTWREAIGAIQESATEAFPSTTPIVVYATVDYFLGLRMWRDQIGGVLQQPDDYSTLVVTTAAVPQPAGLSVTVDWAEQMHRVWVTGSAIGSSGLFDDGSGITRGPVGAISRPNATTQALARAQALAFLNAREPTQGGSFDLLDWEPSAGVHAGGLVTVTDASVDQSAVTYRITEIRKTWNNSGRQNWEVTFGSPPRRALQRVTDLIRSRLAS